MRRLPIRVRLTAVFAVAMVLVLAGAALFVYVRLGEDLDEALITSLTARADAVADLARQSGRGLGGPALAEPGAEPEETFSQVLTAGGTVVASRGGTTRPVLPPALVRAAAGEAVIVDRQIAGLEGTSRVLARPLPVEPGVPGAVVAVGQSLGDRDEALGGLIASFAIGGAVAVLLASLLGYGLATAALRPVEAMRRRAAAVSLASDEQPLPLPDAQDEVRRLGETLNEMLARLRRSFERERRFVADASHELRTPIAVLKTELEALLREDHPPDTREALAAAAEEADHLARLAEDLLVLARASEGRLPIRAERLRTRELLETTRSRFAEPAAQQRRRIEIELPADLEVHADPLRLRQALGNLVDNALRHGAGVITLRACAVDGGAMLDVSDEGPGFDPALADRAFERFARGDEARTRGGTGLGLAIVRAVAEAHGGRAELVPPATVRLRLPAQAPVHRPPD